MQNLNYIYFGEVEAVQEHLKNTSKEHDLPRIILQQMVKHLVIYLNIIYVI